MNPTPSVSVEDGTLYIRNLRVPDDVAVKYIQQLAPEMQVAGVVNCVQLGACALAFAGDKTGAALLADTLQQSTDSTRTVLQQLSKTAQQSVEKTGESLAQNVNALLVSLSKELEKTLDPANTASIIGKLRTALIDDYRKVTSKVREDLDLANPLSPLSALRAELDKSEERRYDALMKLLTELLQQQAAKAAASAERSKSTRKGTDFEKATEEFLMSESRPRKDLVRRTSTEPGLDKNNVGDFVVEINPSEGRDLRIVLEDKNASKSATGLIRELDKAMKNRGAVFGVSVVTDPSPITQAIVPYGDDKLLVRVPALPDGDGWDFTALAVALEAARWKTLMGRAAAGTIDINRVNGDLDASITIANRVTEAKKRITAGKTHLDSIAEYLEQMRGDLLAALNRVHDAVTAGTSDEAA